MLTSVSLAFPVMVGRALWRLRHREWRVRLSQGNWWWAGLPVTALALVYLPGNLLITEQRYFYPALPCLIILHVGILFWWTTTVRPWIHRLGVVLVACAVIVPTLARGWLRPGPARAAGVQAHFLARKISEAHLAGPIAGSGSLSGGRTGLYVAFLLDQPWYGDESRLSADGFKQSGARLIIVRRNNPVVEKLDADPEFRSLDAILVASPEQARASPLKVYELLPWHIAIQNRFGFDLHQDFRRDQPFDFDHARRRPDVLEALSVGAANLFPFINVDHVDTRSDDVLQGCSSAQQRGLNILENLDRLLIRVAGSDDFDARVGCRGARDVDHVADSNRARISDNRFPFGAGGDEESGGHREFAWNSTKAESILRGVKNQPATGR